ncbi:hypothetical protein BDP27DRAFT_1243455, partial [Rhodocollybia butyracea]
ERLGIETNCWLYIGAQHPCARDSYVHFASERLRQEVPSVLDELHGTADRLFTSLMSSRRQDAAELSDKLFLANQRIAELENERRELQNTVQ